MKRLLSILFAVLLTINSTFVASPVLAEDDLSNEEIVETTNEEDSFEEQENNVLKCQELIDALPEEESINDENVYEIAEELLAIQELFEQLDDLQKEKISLEKYETIKSLVDSILVSISNNNNEEENVDEDEFYVPSSSFNYIDEADVPFIKHRKKKLFLDRGVDVLPSSYSLVNDKYVTSVKNQLGWGTCWSFAAMASAESNYLIENNKKSDELNIDLSELQVAWYGYTNYRVKDKLELITNDGIDILVDPGNDDKIISFGGNQQMASFILASEIGFSVESDVSYPTNYSDTETKENTNTYLSQFASEEKINELCYSSDYLVDQIDWYYMDESDTVKRALMERGALAVSYMHEVDEGHDSLQYCGADEMSYFYSASGGNNTNHAVTLVGWDDDYDKNKFSGKNGEKPTNNGAWILKNSWGTSFGDNGYFYISYEEASIKGGVAYGYSMMDKEGYDYDIYQYDGGAKFGYYEIDHSTKVIYGANVYTAKRNEKLEKVGIFTYNTDLKYEIKVYLNPTTSPVSGTLLTTKTGSLKNAGYSLIDIDDDVYIEEGKKYSVVVKYEELTDWISLPVDSSGHVINGDVQLNFNNSGENGQSYYSVNGVNYTDLWSRDGKTARIKALGIPYYDIEYVLDDGTNSANNPDRYIQNEIITFEDPTKDGYYFEGWYTDDDFDSEDKITSTEGYNEDLTLYAHWLPIINKIEFTIDDPVVGEYPDDSITAVVNDGDLLPDDVFENADSLKLVWKDHLSEEMNSYYWPGYPYLAFACVEINKSDYHLASNSDLVVKINGEIWTSQFDDDTSSYYKRRFGREFVTNDSTVDITSLEIDGISFPKAGTAYDKDLNDVVALVNGTKDDDIKVEYDWYDNETKTTPSVSFVDKQDYYLFVTVTIDKDTCEYYDLSSVPAVLKINEQNATQFGSLVDKSIQNDNGKCKQITFYKVVKCRQNPVIAFDDPNITDGMTVYIDGLPKTVHLVDGVMEVDIADTNVGIATTYVTSISTGISDGNEIHSKYPSSMNVYFLNKTSEGHVKAMKNDYYTDIMKYSGTAVRITGNRGLRFKTSINASKNAQLVNGNYEGYVAAEYGTMMCWKSDLQPGEEPVLVKQANGTYLPKYGGKASAFDRGQGIYRLFSMDSSKVVYTGVLVGEYTDSQCGDDFTYRTYLVLRPKDATDSSKDLIIYGGTMYRSISYVALQSKDDAAVKTKGTPEYEFVWKLIRATYGNAYDEPEE